MRYLSSNRVSKGLRRQPRSRTSAKRLARVLVVLSMWLCTASIAWSDITLLNSFGVSIDDGIAVAPTGEVYVLRGDTVQKFDHAGAFLTQWGGSGSGNGQFNQPQGIAVDSVGQVYVADWYNFRVEKFSSSGSFLSQITGIPVWDVAVDSAGSVYALDNGNAVVRKFSSSGAYITQWGSYGTGTAQFNSPKAIAVDRNGYVYVADSLNNRVQVFTGSGQFVRQWGVSSPISIAFDPLGLVYVASGYGLQKFSTAGSPLGLYQAVEGHDVAASPLGSGEVYVIKGVVEQVRRYFDSEAWISGAFVGGMDVAAGPGQPLGTAFTVDSQRNLSVAGTTMVQPGGTLTVNGGSLSTRDLTVLGTYQYLSGMQGITGAISVQSGGSLIVSGRSLSASSVTMAGTGYTDRLSGYGAVNAAISGGNNSVIEASGGDLTLGDTSRFDGFRTTGTLTVGNHAVTLNSRAFAQLGTLTNISGGSLTAVNGVSLGVGGNLAGWGTVNAKVAAGFGSTIQATGNLTIGDATSSVGFTSDGELYTGPYTAVIHDANEAVLGAVTHLGDIGGGGTLTAGTATPSDTHNHLLLEEGKNLLGRGMVNGNFKNHGHVAGDGTAAEQRIVFSSPWKVSGEGTFENTMILGTFAPGNSPGIVDGTNQGFGGTVEIELGGTTPGFGDGHYDQINDSASMVLAGSPTLSILPWNSFIPTPGQHFEIMTWQSGLTGSFGGVQVDPWFTSHGISFNVTYHNVIGAGDLTITAVPEPSALVLLGAGVMALLAYAWRRRRRA